MVVRARAALLACVLTWTAAAAAQQVAETPAEDSARVAFEHGLRLLRDQQWSQAEAEFRSSLAAMPRASTQYDLALVVFKQGRLHESVALLQDLLNADGTEQDPRYREAATALLSQALSGLGVLHLQIEPANAALRVDGELVAVTGAERSVPVDPGQHHVEVTAPGFVAASMDIDVAARGEQQRSIALKANPLPRVQLDDSPAPAAVFAAAPRRSWLARYAPWLTTGIGGALLAASFVVGGIAKHDDEAFSRQCPTHRNCDPRLKPERDRIARLGTASDALLISGAVVTAGGLGWALLVDPGTHGESRGVTVAIAASGRF